MSLPLAAGRIQQLLELVRGWTLDRVVCWGLVFALVFVMGADFRGDTGEVFKVHWQIYLRLLIALACGFVGLLLLFDRTVRDFLTWPGMLLTAYLLWYAVTLPTSLNKTYSAAAWISLLGVTLFLPGAMRLLGGYRFMLAVASGLVTYLVGSWIAYLFFPAVGVFQEQVTQTDVFERMGGLGHPNELGFYSAYTVLVFAGLAVAKRIHPLIALLGAALGFITLYGCFSRTAIIVCGIGLLFAFQNPLRSRANGFAIVLVMALACVGGFVALGSGQLDWAIQDALQAVTKTGNTDELATATGRTEIWAYGLKMIGESPLCGYGYASARFVMEDYSYHCHNIVLNAMMYGGLISGLVVAGMFAYFLYSLAFNPRPEVDGLIAMMLAGGMVEGLLGAPSPAASTTLWFTLLFWRQLGMRLHKSDHSDTELAFDAENRSALSSH